MKPRGFTLVEILIAVAIFALIAVVVSATLQQMLRTEEVSHRHLHQLHQLQMTLFLLENDIEQAVNRSIISSDQKHHPAFIGMPHQLVLTRTGVVTPPGILRSALERVSYQYDKKQLVRKFRPYLEASEFAVKSTPKVLLEDVSDINFEYLDSHNLFHRQWPPVNASQQVLPKGVRVTVVVSEKEGILTQLYLIPSYQWQGYDD